MKKLSAHGVGLGLALLAWAVAAQTPATKAIGTAKAGGGKLLTPPRSRGLLPGILRERLIEERRAEEADLIEADLVYGFLIGNSARGLIRAVAGVTPGEQAQVTIRRQGREVDIPVTVGRRPTESAG